IQHVQAQQRVLDFNAVGTDVLHRRSTNGSGNECQVLKTTITLRNSRLDQFVPVFTGRSGQGTVRFIEGIEDNALQPDMQHQAVEISLQNQVTTAAENEIR